MLLTLFESFATGTPTLISDIDNLNQMVKHEVEGLHFKTGSADSLIASLKRFEANSSPAYYKATRHKYETRYTEQINYQRLMQIYREAIEVFNFENKIETSPKSQVSTDICKLAN